MANVLLVAYLLIVLALIVVILLQRSEGGALGIGGGNNGMMQARGSANLMTRTTAVLATLFFASAIGLTILSELDRTTTSILDSAVSTPDGQQPSTVLDALNALQGDLPVPAQTPAAPVETTTTTPSSDLPVPSAPAETEVAPADDSMMTAPAPEAPAETGTAPETTPVAPTGN
jgi:preprotein translocase subunit SecG